MQEDTYLQSKRKFSLTPAQDLLHGTTKSSNIISDVVPYDASSLHSLNDLVKCKPTKSGDTTIFTFDHTRDAIRPPELHVTLPEVKVKTGGPEVKIAWPLNVVHQIMGPNYLLIDEQVICPHDPVTLDIEQQHFETVTDSKRIQHMQDAGNHRKTLAFTKRLTPRRFRYTLGSPYSLDSPLCTFAVQGARVGSFAHAFDFELSIAKLLRVKVKENGQWVPVTDSGEKRKYIKVQEDNISTPELVARYVNYSEEEKEPLLCRLTDLPNFEATEPGSEGVAVRFRQYVKMDASSQSTSVGGRVTDLNCDYPVIAIVSVSENKAAKEAGCTSNYTTNPENPELGEDPVEKVGITINGHKVVPLTYSEYVCADYETIHSPVHEGYRIKPLCKDLCCLHPDSSVTIANGKLVNNYRKGVANPADYSEHNYLVVMREYRYVKRNDQIKIQLIK